MNHVGDNAPTTSSAAESQLDFQEKAIITEMSTGPLGLANMFASFHSISGTNVAMTIQGSSHERTATSSSEVMDCVTSSSLDNLQAGNQHPSASPNCRHTISNLKSLNKRSRYSSESGSIFSTLTSCCSREFHDNVCTQTPQLSHSSNNSASVFDSFQAHTPAIKIFPSSSLAKSTSGCDIDASLIVTASLNNPTGNSIISELTDTESKTMGALNTAHPKTKHGREKYRFHSRNTSHNEEDPNPNADLLERTIDHELKNNVPYQVWLQRNDSEPQTEPENEKSATMMTSRISAQQRQFSHDNATTMQSVNQPQHSIQSDSNNNTAENKYTLPQINIQSNHDKEQKITENDGERIKISSEYQKPDTFWRSTESSKKSIQFSMNENKKNEYDGKPHEHDFPRTENLKRHQQHLPKQQSVDSGNSKFDTNDDRDSKKNKDSKDNVHDTIFRTLISSGDPCAMVQLAHLYERGGATMSPFAPNIQVAIPEDQHRALILLVAASKFGHPDALFSLGLCYRYGTGVESNDKKAFKFWEDGMMAVKRVSRLEAISRRAAEIEESHRKIEAWIQTTDEYQLLTLRAKLRRRSSSTAKSASTITVANSENESSGSSWSSQIPPASTADTNHVAYNAGTNFKDEHISNSNNDDDGEDSDECENDQEDEENEEDDADEFDAEPSVSISGMSSYSIELRPSSNNTMLAESNVIKMTTESSLLSPDVPNECAANHSGSIASQNNYQNLSQPNLSLSQLHYASNQRTTSVRAQLDPKEQELYHHKEMEAQVRFKDMVRSIAWKKWMPTPHRIAEIQTEMAIALHIASATSTIKRDIKRALILYQAAATVGNTTALCNLGYCHRYGVCLENGEVLIHPDETKAVRFYAQAAAGDHPVGLFNLGNAYRSGLCAFQSPNLTLASACWKRASELGYTRASLALGDLFMFAMPATLMEIHPECVHLETDQERLAEQLRQAEYYLSKACKQPLPCAYLSLGSIRQYQGLHMEALSLYLRAAQLGSQAARFYVGYCYQEGIGITRNNDIAYKWFTEFASPESISASLLALTASTIANDLDVTCKNDAVDGSGQCQMETAQLSSSSSSLTSPSSSSRSNMVFHHFSAEATSSPIFSTNEKIEPTFPSSKLNCTHKSWEDLSNHKNSCQNQNHFRDRDIDRSEYASKEHLMHIPARSSTPRATSLAPIVEDVDSFNESSSSLSASTSASLSAMRNKDTNPSNHSASIPETYSQDRNHQTKADQQNSQRQQHSMQDQVHQDSSKETSTSRGSSRSSLEMGTIIGELQHMSEGPFGHEPAKYTALLSAAACLAFSIGVYWKRFYYQ